MPDDLRHLDAEIRDRLNRITLDRIPGEVGRRLTQRELTPLVVLLFTERAGKLKASAENLARHIALCETEGGTNATRREIALRSLRNHLEDAYACARADLERLLPTSESGD